MLSPYAALSPDYYHDAEICKAEQTDLFARAWIFAGMTDDLSVADDYFLTSIADREVVVRNCQGTLRAFVNVCSHRQSRIHVQSRGNSRMVCPYHGWAYDDDGVPIGIPQAENFPEVCANRQLFALQQLELECVGKFIFVRLQHGGAALQDFLGDAWAFLSVLSAGLDRRLDDLETVFDANWKIVVENAVESYHVPVVHSGTFSSSSQFSTRDEDVSDQQFDVAGHSQRVALADPDWLRRWKSFAQSLGRWPFEFDRYTHQSVFPNFTVTSSMGYVLHVQRFVPDGVGKTRLNSRIYSVHCEGLSEEGSGVMQTIHEEAIKFVRRVIDEDRRACALVHEGSRFASRRAILGHDVEKRVRHFQNAYLKALGGQEECH